MDVTSEVEGSCLCGSVTLMPKVVGQEMAACHCGMCRKWGGGPFMELSCGSDIQIEGEEYIKIFDSSEWAERAFCKNCGTHLFYRLKGTKEHQIPVGLFGNSISPKFNLQVFIDRKPEYYSFKEKTKEMTEAEIFEMYAS